MKKSYALLEGNSKIIQEDEKIKGEYLAEKIKLFFDEEKVLMENKVRGKIYRKKK